MFGNGQIIISHTHEDNQRCQPLLAALDAWQINYWFDVQELDAGQRFSDRIQQALEQRDIFVRVTTPAAERSFWMDRELRAVRGLRAAFPEHPRLIIHLVLAGDASQVSPTAGPGEVVIDATRTPRSLWMHELRQALGTVVGRRVSRRTAIAAGAASVVAVATTAVAAKIFLSPAQAAANPFHPDAVPHPASLEPGALVVRWQYSIGFDAPAEDGGLSSNKQVGLAADDTAVYALSPSSQVAFALSLHDSSLLWVYPNQSGSNSTTLNGSTIATAPGSDSLFILAGVAEDQLALIAVEKASGKLLWMSPNLVPESADFNYSSGLCLADSAIFFQVNGSLYGYSQDGKPLWPPLPMFTYTTNTAAPLNIPAPAFAGGLIFVSTYDGRLLAVEAASGALVWSVQLTAGAASPLQASPAVAGGLVYIGAPDGYCYAFNASSGSLAWKFQLVNLASYNKGFNFGYFALMSAATVANGVVFMQTGIDNDNYAMTGNLLFALEGQSGKQVWKVDPTTLNLPLHIPSVTGITSVAPWYPAGNLIYTTVSFLSASAGLNTSLASAQGLLALNQQDGSLHSYYLAPVDGENLQSGFFPSAPVPVPGGMAFMTNEPQVYVLDL